MICSRCIRATLARRQAMPLAMRQFSAARLTRSAEPPLSTPVTTVGEEAPSALPQRSICVAGTVLNGLNFEKGKPDPMALKDEEYPEWLWSCLEIFDKGAGDAQEDMGDEFAKSKKQRRLAAKRQRELEAKLLAEGNTEALAPKIPLQHQSINLPGSENGTPEENLVASEARQNLKRAMRKERKANIKEQNYLKSM